MSQSPPDLATELLRLAEADPARLTELATEVARRARTGGDLELGSSAHRALGIAALHVTDLRTAERHLRDAIRLAVRAGSPELAAEARLRLAFVRCVQGRMEQAISEVELALPDLHGAGRARAEAQRAVIFNHLRRPEDALASYRLAVPVLSRAGDHLWLQRVLSNRGIVHGYRHEFAAAESDFQEAERLCRRLDLGLSLAVVWQNLGWLNALRGEVPAALRYLDQAEERFRTLDTHQLCWTLADRTELLLSAGLIAEAREAAEETVQEFERRGRKVGLPEARLLLARTAYLVRDHEEAVREARRAALAFGRQHRREWVAVARFVALRSLAAMSADDRPVSAGGRGGRVSGRQMEECAAELAETGWPASEVEARMIAARLAVDAGRPARAERQWEIAARRRHRGPAGERIHAWHAAALLRLARGNVRGARSAIRTALRLHDEHRATLGATDLRAHASESRVEVAELGLRLALRDGVPADVLTWAERGRARHLLMRPARPAHDRHLAEALAQLRLTVARIDESRTAGEDTGALVERQITLEREIRDHCRRQKKTPTEPVPAEPAPPTPIPAEPGPTGSGPTGPVPLRQVAEALGEQALVEFVQVDDVLHAITVAGGRSRLHALGPLAAVRTLVDRVPFALRRLARRTSVPGSQAAALNLLRDTVAKLDALLLRPLAADLRDRPLVLVPSGPIQALPWSLLPSCAGRAICVSPSATLWYAGSQAGHARTGDARVVVAAGPGLPGARSEAEGVASIHAVPALVDDAAGAEAVLADLDGAALAHVAAHGRIHPSNPLFSSLRLADGPLTVYDLERLRRAPEIVVLAACDTGRFVVRPGDELLGLSATFLALGTRTIVAPVLSILDTESTTLMIALHKLLAAGHSTASALAQAQQQVARDNLEAYAVAAGFVCLGADSTMPA
ncbi:CHAT domain-containing tetratricopeptide repeat protein [Nonomuraea fuscirosea]|uniref:CHAT domain-containing protein n=1 Tax=Nonomuraea fuscirosea TaxID=1291556 RepID=UPI002DDB12C5|nr:CHAT domain-containing tetratricopeptide repeat protein [Nonomuraea fuscirosea]WSA55610.1 CHAT domain-containing protein [Nonomuraea fuscirosea]